MFGKHSNNLKLKTTFISSNAFIRLSEILFLNLFAHSYNPFIYCWLNKTFKDETKKYFCLRCCCQRNESINENLSNRRFVANEVQIETNRNNIELQEIQVKFDGSTTNLTIL